MKTFSSQRKVLAASKSVSHTVLGTLAFSVLALSSGFSSSAQAVSFTPLGDLAGGNFFSEALAVSDNGETVVGQSASENGVRAFRWSRATGIQALGTMVGSGVSDYHRGAATAVSAKGDVIVGYTTPGVGTHSVPFKWTAAGGMQALEGFDRAATEGWAYAVSPDGSAVFGSLATDQGTRAFKSIAGTTSVFATVTSDQQENTQINAVSDDGTRLVGFSGGSYANPRLDAVSWHDNPASTEVLGALHNGSKYHKALAVSADGRTVVGDGVQGADTLAMMWVDGVAKALGDLPGGAVLSSARAVSADGTLVGGMSESDKGQEAFLWSAKMGMKTLSSLLIEGGVKGIEGWRLSSINAISRNGRWVVGTAVNASARVEAFIANIAPNPVPLPAAVWLFLGGLAVVARVRKKGSR